MPLLRIEPEPNNRGLGISAAILVSHGLPVVRITLILIMNLMAAPPLRAQTLDTKDRRHESAKVGELAKLLSTKCLVCHKQGKSEGAYSMDTFSALMKPGDSGLRPVAPGHAEKSELVRRLITTDVDERMPADSPPLADSEIQLVKDWINSIEATDTELWRQPITRLASRSVKSAPMHYGRVVPITAMALESDARGLWVSGYTEIVCWDIADATVRDRLPVGGTQVVALSLSSDNQRMAVSCGVAGEYGLVQLWSKLSKDERSTGTDSNWQLQWTESLSDIAPDIAFSPDNARLAIACMDGALEIAQLTVNEDALSVRSQRLTPHADAILSLSWSDKGDRLATASRDRTVKVFDANKMELIANYDRHERAVGGVTYVESNPVSLDETGKLRLWTGDDNDRTLAERDNLARFLERLVHLDNQLWLADRDRLRQFSVERKTVDDGKDDSGNAKTKKVLRWQEQAAWSASDVGWILSVQVTPTTIAVGDDRGQVTVWSMKDRSLLKQFRANP